jgi:hypothetical protein
LRSIAWPLRFLLFGCAIATVSPRFDITLAATLLGSAILGFVHLRGRPAQVDVSAG